MQCTVLKAVSTGTEEGIAALWLATPSRMALAAASDPATLGRDASATRRRLYDHS